MSSTLTSSRPCMKALACSSFVDCFQRRSEGTMPSARMASRRVTTVSTTSRGILMVGTTLSITWARSVKGTVVPAPSAGSGLTSIAAKLPVSCR